MRRLTLVFLFLLCLSMGITAQELVKEVDFDYTTIQKVAVDNNFIYAAGYYEIPASSKLRDAFVVKLTSDGQIVWHNSFGGNLFDRINDFVVEGDRIYATGVTWTRDSRSQVWFVVISSDGQIILQKDYGNRLDDGAYRILPTGDGNFYLLGYATPQGINQRNLWILKLDAQGSLLWDKQLGALADNEEALNALLLNDGMLVLARTWQKGVSDLDPWIIMMSYDGQIIWQTKNHLYEDNFFVKPLKYNNGFLLIGETWEKIKTKKGDIWLVQIDPAGKTLRDNVLGTSVVEEIKDGLLCNGKLWLFGGYNRQLNACIWKLTPDGVSEAQKVFDLPLIYSAASMGNDQFVVGGGQGKKGYVAIVKTQIGQNE